MLTQQIGMLKAAGTVSVLLAVLAGTPCRAGQTGAAPVTGATVVEKGKDVAVAVKDWTVEEYKESKEKIEARIAKIEKRIEELGEKAEKTGADGRDAAKKEMKVLKGKLASAKEQLKKFVKAGVKGSKDLWTSLGEAVDDVEDGAEKAWKRFGK